MSELAWNDPCALQNVLALGNGKGVRLVYLVACNISEKKVLYIEENIKLLIFYVV